MNSGAKRASIYLGVFMAVVMVAGVVAAIDPAGRIDDDADQPLPTATVLPTFPPPPADFSSITFDKVYLHPSGIFSIGQPTDWNASQPNKGRDHRAGQPDQQRRSLAVVDSYVEALPAPITSADLSAHFTEAAITPELVELHHRWRKPTASWWTTVW